MLIFFFNDTATTEIYTLSLHYALPISAASRDGPAGNRRSPSLPGGRHRARGEAAAGGAGSGAACPGLDREEHTSELQSRQYLVCRLLLEKKKKHNTDNTATLIIAFVHQ